jgi:hypothetical protein
VIVVVDASFEHRIDESERQMFHEAEAAGELVSPPAGAIGRGDRFLLQISDRIGATVLSNDSFQEFHGDYEWLFDEGRLIGGKPVPGVGWIFTPRAPVRGPRSRIAVRQARKTTEAPAEPVASAIAEAKADVLDSDGAGGRDGSPGRRRRRRGKGPAEPVNEPLVFIRFIAEHRPGSEVEGTVDEFTSHGAFVDVDGARCYVPLTGLGDPAPRSAREVLDRGAQRTFVVQALDPPRRGIELALPDVARVSGVPTDETVEAEIERSDAIAEPAVTQPARATSARKATTPTPNEAATEAAPKKAATPKKAAAPKTAAAPKKAAAKKATPKKVAAPKKAATPKTAAAPKTAAPTKAATPKKAAATKAPATKKTPAKKATKAASKKAAS